MLQLNIFMIIYIFCYPINGLKATVLKSGGLQIGWFLQSDDAPIIVHATKN